jgi:hypothetical protein
MHNLSILRTIKVLLIKYKFHIKITLKIYSKKTLELTLKNYSNSHKMTSNEHLLMFDI